MAHDVVKPEQIAATAAVLLEESLVIPALFHREGIDQFKGAKDDTINVVVEGVLPFHTYGWRSDRSAGLVFDEYTEKKVAVSFGGDAYSAVRLTDEQAEMDTLGDWTKLARKQTEAVGTGIEYGSVDELRNAPYEVVIGVDQTGDQLRKALIEARNALNKMRAPGDNRVFVVGTDWEAALLEDPKLSLASSVGETEAVAALTQATLGTRYGFKIVVSQEIDPTEAYAMVDNAFVFLNGAPKAPQSVPFGASASYNDVALRWIRDYDTEYLRDRSVFNTYYGYRTVTDSLLGVDADTKNAYVSDYEHFVRAIKLELAEDQTAATAATVYPDASATGSTDAVKKSKELAKITGLKQPSWTQAPAGGGTGA